MVMLLIVTGLGPEFCIDTGKLGPDVVPMAVDGSFATAGAIFSRYVFWAAAGSAKLTKNPEKSRYFETYFTQNGIAFPLIRLLRVPALYHAGNFFLQQEFR
jgi:hypothetical protein